MMDLKLVQAHSSVKKCLEVMPAQDLSLYLHTHISNRNEVSKFLDISR